MSESKEVILDRMLNNIDDSYDKTVGSFFYDAEKPIAIELESMSQDVDAILDKGFADTATDDDLDRICAEQGIFRKVATKAYTTVTVTGSVGANINSVDKVASDTVNFIFTEDAVIPSGGSIDVTVECEIAGTIGNVAAEAIKYFPVTLSGLIGVTNTSAITNGYDEETDDELRERYYIKVQTPPTSGNKYQYLNWAKEVTGVGDASIIPLWNGNGTVKVVIINSNKRAADPTLIDTVSTHIEDNRPIGATVTVISATEKPININVSLIIDDDNYTIAQVINNISDSLTEYFKDIAFTGAYVSYAKIGSLIFDSAGVKDYNNLQVNNDILNVIIGSEEVAVLGGVVNG